MSGLLLLEVTIKDFTSGLLEIKIKNSIHLEE